MAISMIEVSRIDSDGVWLLTQNEEIFMSYEDFPWFKNQSIQAVLHVQEPSPDHFYWPEIDVDLTAEMIKNPERFPLQASCDDIMYESR